MPGGPEARGRDAVLFVNTGGDVGGSEMCLLRLMAGLRANGRETLLACPPGSTLARRAMDEGATVWPLDVPPVLDPDASFELVDPALGLRGRSRWRRSLGAGLRALRMPPAAWRLARRLRRAGVRIVHANTPRASLVAGLAARLSGRPAVTHVRDIVLSPFARPARRAVLRALSDVFIAPSRATAALVGGLRPVHVIHDGLPQRVLDHTSPHRALRPEAPEIGMVAAMTPWKGHESLIRATPLIRSAYPAVRVTILGGDWGHPVFAAYRARLQALVEKLGLTDVVRLVGDASDVPARLAAFDVFVHPPTSPDPFPGAVLEACLAGCPIVATDTGGIPEIVGHERSALLVPPGDVNALSAAVLRLLGDPGLAARLGETAREDVRRFSLEAETEAVEAVYASLLRVKPGA
jgi:glycosyltransferase involved in cell wall biosynthesis